MIAVSSPVLVHATAVVIGESGVLIEGPSGSGKSSLALALLADAWAQGRFGALVGDDRVALTVHRDRLVARPHATIAGLIERRGIGILRGPYEPSCVVRLLVRLCREAGLPERNPEQAPSRVLLGVKLPVLDLQSSTGSRDASHSVFALLFGPFVPMQ